MLAREGLKQGDQQGACVLLWSAYPVRNHLTDGGCPTPKALCTEQLVSGLDLLSAGMDRAAKQMEFWILGSELPSTTGDSHSGKTYKGYFSKAAINLGGVWFWAQPESSWV